MFFREISTPTLKNLFIREIQAMILSGELKIGDKLPPERAIADQMKISTAVVNSGIKELERLGFLRISARQGTFVEDYKKHGSIETLNAILEYNGHVFQPETLSALFDFRRQFEVLCAGEAANHRTESDLQELHRILEQFSAEVNLTSLSELAFSFHHAIASSTGNVIYSLLFSSFRTIYCSLYYVGFSNSGKDVYLGYFQELYRLILEQDGHAASEFVLQVMIPHCWEFIEKYCAPGKEYPLSAQ